MIRRINGIRGVRRIVIGVRRITISVVRIAIAGNLVVGVTATSNQVIVPFVVGSRYERARNVRSWCRKGSVRNVGRCIICGNGADICAGGRIIRISGRGSIGAKSSRNITSSGRIITRSSRDDVSHQAGRYWAREVADGRPTDNIGADAAPGWWIRIGAGAADVVADNAIGRSHNVRWSVWRQSGGIRQRNPKRSKTGIVTVPDPAFGAVRFNTGVPGLPRVTSD